MLVEVFRFVPKNDTEYILFSFTKEKQILLKSLSFRFPAV